MHISRALAAFGHEEKQARSVVLSVGAMSDIISPAS
jgi:hypothetical protein